MKKSSFIALLLFFLVALFLFKDFILKSHIPFPGDLLISEYVPFKYESYLGYNPGSYPNKAQYFDVARQMLPWKNFVADSIKNFSIPFWNPYNFSGSPLLANNQSAPFYPGNIVFFILPFGFAWTGYLGLQIILGGLFTYLFARVIKISYISSIAAGLMYSMGLFMSTFFEYGIVGHTILWLPLILYSYEKLASKFSNKYFLLFIFSILSSFLAGHLQIFSLSFGFIIFYILLKTLVFNRKKTQVQILLIPLACIGLASFLLRHTLELIAYSARVPHSYKSLLQFLIQPSEFILFLSPDFFGNPVSRNYMLDGSYPGNAVYIGVVGAFFATYGFFLWKKNMYVKIFTILFAFLILFLTKNPISALVFKFPIPFISSSSPSNGLFLVSFVMSILAGIGIDQYVKEKIAIKRVGVFVVILITVVGSAILTHDAFIIKSLIFTIGILVCLLTVIFTSQFSAHFKKYSVIFILFLLVGDLSYFFLKFNPFSPKEFLYPPHEVLTFVKDNAGINRVWGYGFASLEPNIETYYKIYSPNGYDPLYPKWYGEFIHSSQNGKLLKDFDGNSRSNAIVAPGFGAEDLPTNFSRLKVLDSLGIKYILDRVENGSSEMTFPPERFERVYSKNNWFVYENKNAAPRIFFTDNFRAVSNNDEFEKEFFSDSFDPQRQIIISSSGKFSSGSAVISEIQNLEYLPNSISFDITVPGSGYVFISDTYYPRWEVVSPPHSEIVRANHAFRAIPVIKGQHHIQLEYNGGVRSGNFGDLMAIGISFASAAILIAYGFIQNRKDK